MTTEQEKRAYEENSVGPHTNTVVIIGDVHAVHAAAFLLVLESSSGNYKIIIRVVKEIVAHLSEQII